ncbi:MAG: ABC transporter permease [Acidobacteriota bacterium]
MTSLPLIFRLFVASSQIQRKRALLTIASIAWGTVAIVLLLAFGEGLKRQLTKNKHGMGINLAIMWPSTTTKPFRGLPSGRFLRARTEDVDLLRERLPELAGVTGEMQAWGTPLSYGKKIVSAHVLGASAVYGELRQQIARAGGRFIDGSDEEDKRRVVFLGDQLARDLCGSEAPEGKTVLVDGSPYTVVGVMVHKNQMGAYSGPDESHAVIPITTFKAQFGRERLDNLVLQARTPGEMAGVLKRVREILSPRLGFDPGDERALQTWDTVETGKTMDNVLVGIQLFLGIVGALTLVIGGVGVANIMYAVVKERTREIGVKMALGARAGWITGAIVIEGLAYTLVGGAAGMTIATLILIALDLAPTGGNKALEFLGKPTLSPGIGLATIAILGLIGIASGYFPARRAASIDPAQTLRYE